MEKKARLGIIFFTGLIIVLMLTSFIVEILQQNKRKNNLYNIENPIKQEIELKLPAVAIFNEFVMDNFNGIEIEKDNFKLYRVGDIVEGSENNDALDFVQGLTNFSKKNINLKDVNEFKTINYNIFNKNYKNLNIDYINGVNSNESNSQIIENYIKSFSTNRSVVINRSGYVVNYYDGYETLFNIDNPQMDLESLKGDKQINKMPGLKYVDNKMYHIVTYIEDLNQININSLKQIGMNILKNNEQSYTFQAMYEDTIILDKGYLLIFKLFDGIEDSIDNRFFDIKLNLGEYETYRIPNTAITTRNGVEGVLYLSGNKIKFTPIKIEKEEDNFLYVSNNFSEIFPNTDIKNIEFEHLYPFTKIIKNPTDYIEGEIY